MVHEQTGYAALPNLGYEGVESLVATELKEMSCFQSSALPSYIQSPPHVRFRILPLTFSVI